LAISHISGLLRLFFSEFPLETVFARRFPSVFFFENNGDPFPSTFFSSSFFLATPEKNFPLAGFDDLKTSAS